MTDMAPNMKLLKIWEPCHRDNNIKPKSLEHFSIRTKNFMKPFHTGCNIEINLICQSCSIQGKKKSGNPVIEMAT